VAYLSTMKRLITAVLTAILLAGCLSTANIKPLPPGAKPCGSNWDCPTGMYCGFPGVGTHAQCLHK
jgi:hypothetical protein